MVIIRSKTFNLGEHVQPKIGHKFYGLRDGRLAFLDENEIVYSKVIALSVKSNNCIQIMKVTLITLLAICASIFTGCTTPVAIDPLTGQEQLAEYRAGFFYAPIDAPIGQIFKTAIRELDDLGYFRTGELHKDTAISIYCRKVGDDKITVRISQQTDPEVEEQSEIRIRVGNLGNLAESQVIYARIRDAL